MKKSRNATRTRALILEKAAQIFAAKGYEGTALSEIVRAAGVTKRMIYHYYGDKQGLYRAIFIHEWGLLKDWYDRALRLRMAAGEASDTKELIAQSVGIFFDFLVHRPQFVRLMMWEGLEGGEISQSIWKDIRGPLYIQMEFLIKQAQQEGLLDPDLDAAHFVVTFLGAISFYFGYAPTLVDMLHQEPYSKDALSKRKAQLLRLLDNLYRQ